MTIKIHYTQYGHNEVLEYASVERAALAIDDTAGVYTAEEWLKQMADCFDDEDEIPVAEGAYHWDARSGERSGWADSEEQAWLEVIDCHEGHRVVEGLLSPSEAADLFMDFLAEAGYSARVDGSNKSSSHYISVALNEEVDFEIGFRTHSAPSQLPVQQWVSCPITLEALQSEMKRFPELAARFVEVVGV